MRKGLLLILISCFMLTGCIKGTTDVSEGNIVDVQRAEAEMAKIYKNVDELVEDSNNIVLGECVKLESFIEDDGVIWTKETFHVDETLNGEISNDSDIAVYIMGGNIPVKDYLDTYNGIFKDQIENRYKDCNEDDMISFVYGDDRLPVKGEKSILFLTDSTLYDGYSRVGAFMGSFYEKTQDNKNTLSSSEKVFEGYIGNYTLEEFKESINEN